MEAKACFTVLFGLCAVGNAANSGGTFWQITDLHLDEAYSENGYLDAFCHGNGSGESSGHYGNFSCDAPWVLIEEAIKAMKKINPDPNFVLWTGDAMPHINDSLTSWNDVYSQLKRITSLLMNTFKNTTIIPVLGNHDAHPPNDFPGSGFKEHYQRYLTEAGWEDLIPPEQVGYFRKGGYYSYFISEALKVIVLNTNLYLNSNSQRSSDPDPGGQLEWLRKQLKLARDHDTAVIVTAHAPPGFFERVTVSPFLASPFNEVLIGLFVNYSDVLLSQVYGHTHTDSFRLFSDSEGVARTQAFIAPSVSPWKVPLTGTRGVNPSVRLYLYSVSEVMISDYYQYFLNLTKANLRKNAQWVRSLDIPVTTVEVLPTPLSLVQYREASNVKDSDSGMSTAPGAAAKSHTVDTSSYNPPVWELLYQATELYGVHNLTVMSLGKIYTDMSIKQSVFDSYYDMNTVGVQADACNNTCQQMHLCAIRQLTTSSMDKCLAKFHMTRLQLHARLEASRKQHEWSNNLTTTTPEPSEDIPHHRHHPHAPPYMKHVILGTALALLTVLIIVTAVCMRRLKYRLGYRHTRLISINND